MSKPDAPDRTPAPPPETKAALERAWMEENAEAIRLHNERIDREGPAFPEYRRF